MRAAGSAPWSARRLPDIRSSAPKIPFPVTDGVVVGMGLHDELSGDLFAAVKTAAGQGYYVRLSSQAGGACCKRRTRSASVSKSSPG